MIRWPANPTKVEQNSTLVLPYSSRDAAQAFLERLEERVVSECLEGNSKFLIGAEVVDEDGVYRISVHLLHPNNEGWLERGEPVDRIVSFSDSPRR